MTSKYSDNTNMGGIVDRQDGCQNLQQDLDRLGRWVQEWLIEFNTEKSKVLHFGRSIQGRDFTVNDRGLGSVKEQRGLGVQVHSSLKVADMVVKAAFDT